MFIQVIHAIVYSILVRGAFEAFDMESGKGNFVLYITCVVFMFKAEKIIKGLFNIKETQNTLGDYANAGKTGMAAVSTTRQLFTRNRQEAMEDLEDTDEESDEEEKKGNRTNIPTPGAQANIEANSSNPQPAGGSPNAGEGAEASGEGAPAAAGSSAGSSGETEEPSHLGALMPNIQKAARVLQKKAAKPKKRNIGLRMLNTAVSVTARTAGTVIGAAAGLAMGSPMAALRNAALMNKAAGTFAKGVNGLTNGITGYAVGRFQGARVRFKVQNGEFDDDLREAGVDIDALYADKKAELIRKALGKSMSGTRRKGKDVGELKLVKTIEREIRK